MRLIEYRSFSMTNKHIEFWMSERKYHSLQSPNKDACIPIPVDWPAGRSHTKDAAQRDALLASLLPRYGAGRNNGPGWRQLRNGCLGGGGHGDDNIGWMGCWLVLSWELGKSCDSSLAFGYRASSSRSAHWKTSSAYLVARMCKYFDETK